MNFVLACMTFLLAASNISSQIPQDSILQAKVLLADIDSLESTLWKTHQNPLTYCNRKEFDDAFDAARSQVRKGVTFYDFAGLMAQSLRVMKDSHSYIKFSSLLQNYKADEGLFLNFSIKTVENEIFINRDLEYLIPKGSQLVSINKLPINGLFNQVSKYSILEGNSNIGLRRIAEAIFANIIVLSCEIKNTNEIEFIAPDSSEKTIIQYPGKIWKLLAKENKKKLKSIEDNSNNTYELLLDDSSSLATLKIKSFSANSNRKYHRFLRKSFKTIAKKEIQNLAIDLRNNTGGKADRVGMLYSYISEEGIIMPSNIIAKQSDLSIKRYDKTFKGLARFITKHFYKKNESVQNYRKMVMMPIHEVDTFYFNTPSEVNKKLLFKGNKYLLINGKSGSASVNFTAGFKANKLGTIVGESCLGPMSGTWGNPAVYTLPNSKLKVFLSTIRFNTNDYFEYQNKSIQPDFQVNTSIEDFQRDKDTQIEFIKNELLEK